MPKYSRIYKLATNRRFLDDFFLSRTLDMPYFKKPFEDLDVPQKMFLSICNSLYNIYQNYGHHKELEGEKFYEKIQSPEMLRKVIDRIKSKDKG